MLLHEFLATAIPCLLLVVVASKITASCNGSHTFGKHRCRGGPNTAVVVLEQHDRVVGGSRFIRSKL